MLHLLVRMYDKYHFHMSQFYQQHFVSVISIDSYDRFAEFVIVSKSGKLSKQQFILEIAITAFFEILRYFRVCFIAYKSQLSVLQVLSFEQHF